MKLYKCTYGTWYLLHEEEWYRWSDPEWYQVQSIRSLLDAATEKSKLDFILDTGVSFEGSVRNNFMNLRFPYRLVKPE